MRLTKLIFLSAMLLVLSLSASGSLAQTAKPNIVYLLVDNWGWGDLGVQGGTTPTPRIDALAAEGIRWHCHGNYVSQQSPIGRRDSGRSACGIPYTE